ncbi:apolipoprotein C-II [Trichomycterus rosablanca]|uniref:apolipoprotein C-II n=1 Tax=Trichomycterus rosablanca TaxID=2290929 RepID=UPI002F355FDB
MQKVLIFTLLITALSLGAESFRVPREAEEEEQATVTTVLDTLRSYYDQSVNTASSYYDSLKDLKLEEKAKNLYDETTQAVRTYAGIFQDQLYHMIYPDNH